MQIEIVNTIFCLMQIQNGAFSTGKHLKPIQINHEQICKLIYDLFILLQYNSLTDLFI